ncbi:uncharacterized protein LOC109802010 [Cajanus cajan]|uniref:uncharacterized protein LOC109802010 n=1 Tax=Cajanus cajan TaxID=3821 RepID=UPI00098D77CC|nr:uncharacterized protein LOC109802010 [Cajanus cajan]
MSAMIEALNIISWNIRGAVNAKGRRRSIELVQLHHPTIFVVMETHCLFSSAESFWTKLDYKLCNKVEARGHSGGIWILIAQHSQQVTSEVVVSPQALIDDCNLLDLGATGLRFTWYRNQLGFPLAKRLDRALCDTKWQTLFPNAFVENLCQVYSDHCPLLVRCGSLIETKKNRPFRFQAAWATHKGFEKIIKDAWKRSTPTLVNGLNTVWKEAIEFNRNVFGTIFSRKREIQARLKGAQFELEK